jgi:methylenetetrahydrofolate dehydrogenase (NADP+)/methenyltetrahydrofolate cyclohydrolase
MTIIIDGKKIAGDIRQEVKDEVMKLKAERGIVPGLAVVLVGDDPASNIYVRRKKEACEEVGFLSREYRLPADTSEGAVLELIHNLNREGTIHGILVQFPVPRQIRAVSVIEAIDPAKDVDGLHPINAGKLLSGYQTLVPCTPAGIIELLDRSGNKIEGTNAVIIGRSNLVGKPLAMLFLLRNATVTICHTKTRDLEKIARCADILVAAAGRAEMVKGNMVKDGSVVIDVGINRLDDGRLVGDVAFAEAARRASYITPVPGGVGPMTIAMLLKNTLAAAKQPFFLDRTRCDR